MTTPVGTTAGIGARLNQRPWLQGAKPFDPSQGKASAQEATIPNHSATEKSGAAANKPMQFSFRNHGLGVEGKPMRQNSPTDKPGTSGNAQTIPASGHEGRPGGMSPESLYSSQPLSETPSSKMQSRSGDIGGTLRRDDSGLSGNDAGLYADAHASNHGHHDSGALWNSIEPPVSWRNQATVTGRASEDLREFERLRQGNHHMDDEFNRPQEEPEKQGDAPKGGKMKMFKTLAMGAVGGGALGYFFGYKPGPDPAVDLSTDHPQTPAI